MFRTLTGLKLGFIFVTDCSSGGEAEVIYPWLFIALFYCY